MRKKDLFSIDNNKLMQREYFKKVGKLIGVSTKNFSICPLSFSKTFYEPLDFSQAPVNIR